MQEKYDISGMSCAACSARIEKSVSALPNIKNVSVNLLKNTMVVEYDEKKLNRSQIISAVTNAGYGAALQNKNAKTSTFSAPPTNAKSEYETMKQRLIWSIAFTIPLFYLSMGNMLRLPTPSFFSGNENALVFALTQFLLLIPVVFINFKYYANGYKSLFQLSPNMDSLIAMGSNAAIVYGIYAMYKISFALGHGDTATAGQFARDLYFEGAATILTLITLGNFLETHAKGKTTDAINKLLNLSPKTATVLTEDAEKIIPVEEVKKDDILIVKTGEAIPVDGIILEGNAFIDESMITGESVPTEKNIGDRVIGATMTKSGYFKMKAVNVGDETALSQIIRLVDEATSSKAPIAKTADKVAGIFVPVVILIALISVAAWLFAGADLEFALSIGISVLVVSCPCALGLATPTSIMVGTGRGATNGILIKSAESLETAHAIQTVVMDKTGTLTQGKPSVTDIIIFNGNENDFIQTAASLENLSEHPLAQAIVEEAKKRNIEFLPVNDFKQISGKGIKGKINSKECFAGNEKLLSKPIKDNPKISRLYNEISEEGKTALFFAIEKEIIGIIGIADAIKPTSREAVEQLEKLGIDVIMLTGDNKKTAETISAKTGIKHFIAQLLPQDKEREITRLQQSGKTVAMVGDGINDAPALAKSNVGIAIGAGADIALESADIALMKNDLLDVVSAIELSKATMKNIKQNLFWAFFYNILCIPIAAGCYYAVLGLKMNPMIAALAMSFSSVFVVTNALRLRFFKPTAKTKIKKNNETTNSEFSAKVRKININFNPQLNETNGETMKKEIAIEGMMCQHCVNHVKKALTIDGVSEINIDLENKKAVANVSNIPDEKLKSLIEEAGYKVMEIKTI